MSVFKKAVRAQKKLRFAVAGPPGSGKTFSCLAIARAFGGRTVVLDTEHGSATLYADEWPGWEYEHVQLPNFDPRTYVDYIHLAEKEGFENIIIDSFSHAWDGKGGALELKDTIAARGGENSFSAWRHITPMHNALVDAILSSPANMFVAMRAKMDHVMETDPSTGRTVVKKVGMGAIQRQGVEFEFDIIGDIDIQNKMTISKTRCRVINGQTFYRPGDEFGAIIKNWLNSGAPQDGVAALAAVTGYVLDPARVVRLTDLMTAANYSPQQLNASLAARGVSRIEGLTEAQADVMIEALEKRVHQMYVMTTPPAPSPSGVQPVAPHPAEIGSFSGFGNRPDAALDAPSGTPAPSADISPAGLAEAVEAHAAAFEGTPAEDFTISPAERPDRNSGNSQKEALTAAK